ncbi:hypothetical protein GLOTRDRAFT_46026 [Gloeophyllum trabeum ATCC 11539]|uniref:DUF4218 domain-containing protein n=1 Tax=Gloeophyllum trabeum (strain ATCC 11539 / FP-39264 / Madison 617) TaxID=670483 RepID=S7RKZ9_GLOTA|nr:uncharacterized protein GLOTRDRAFT_46026 [Gloeophyllum trabeum ATCC 11539]EPQ53349.1 hypothetical protein GLOTRDRAFT_46026 [Gloeophyllum trabeum ATCC 11539]
MNIPEQLTRAGSQPPEAVRVVCLCRTCSTASYVDAGGKTQSGRLVHPKTRRAHFVKDHEALRDAVTNQLDDSQDHKGDQSSTDDCNQPQQKERGRRTRSKVRSRKGKRRTDMQQSSPIITLALVLAAWLHICCGLSRRASTVVLKVIHIIFFMAFQLALTVSVAPESALPKLNLKDDIHSALSTLSIDPVLIRSVCCPKCFAQYPVDHCPEFCRRRETRRSKPCGEALWTVRHGSNAGPQPCPRRLYTTQSFEAWLTWFLSRPGIEDLIEESYTSQPSPDGIMYSIRDSPAWQSFGSFTSTRGNLVFSFFIDWFNPLTNKIAGKKISTGAIMLFCLNLPEHLQWAPENTFFAGITPPPNEPSVTTITHIVDPVIDQLADFYTGKLIPTYKHPHGSWTRAGVMPFIGDLVAIRKGAGFASHSAEPFCSFCPLRRSEIESLDLASWGTRTGAEVRMAAGLWRDAQTKAERKRLFSQYGVRWSALHKLFYRNPVQHTVLGVMHNWMEGILQHHARRKWGIGIESGPGGDDKDDLGIAASAPGDDNFMDIDTEDLSAEVDALLEDSITHYDLPLSEKRTTSPVQFRIDSSGEESGDDDFIQPDDESDSDDDSSTGPSEPGNHLTCEFNPTNLSKIRACIGDVVLPTWVERPPRNLGDKSHGKLKADNWFILFSVILPMVLVEMWSSRRQTARHKTLLDNFYDLVTCTNIVGSFSTSNVAADRYTEHYIRYRSSLQKLYPHSGSVPNHHYAMHNGEMLKFWGPLMSLSEFPYERHNGRLQKIKTNGHMGEYPVYQLDSKSDKLY